MKLQGVSQQLPTDVDAITEITAVPAKGSASDFYPDDILFESRPRHQLS
jgi:hypothetical protein